MDDSLIIELLLSRDEEALVQLASKYGARLLRIAQSIVTDVPTAEECVNDAYFDAWNLIPSNEPRGYLFEFMARIVRHKAIDRVRREKAQKRGVVLTELTHELEECLPSQGSVEDEIGARELQRRINGFLNDLPPEKCDIFLRRYWFADSIEAIAKRFHRTKGSVKNILWRLRNELRETLDHERGSLK